MLPIVTTNPVSGVSRSMKIVVMGSGSLGGYFGGLLAKSGEDVTFIARGNHLKAIQTNGLTVKSVEGTFTVKAKATDKPETTETPDLILFTVKTYDTVTASKALAPIVGPETSIITIQNGVTSKEEIEDILGQGKVLPGSAYIETTVEAPGVIHQLGGPRKILFGEADGSRSTRVIRIEELLKKAGINHEVSEDVVRELWQKFLFICALAGVTCATRLTLGEILSYDSSRWAFEETIRETHRVGVAHGVRFTQDAVEKALNVAKAMSPNMKSSMQRDMESGRRLEIDTLNRTVVNLGKKYGIPVPLNESIYAFVKPYDELAQEK